MRCGHEISIVFFGSGPVAAASLDFLSKSFTIEAVITKASPPHHKYSVPVEELANDRNLPLYFANNKNELELLIKNQSFKSVLGIIVDFGVIVPSETIGYFPMGIINSHFSLLPQWRGADPITFAILSGQEKTGVSLMLIEPELDTGKIIVQKSLSINPNETTPSLTERLINLSNRLLLEYVPKHLDGEAKARRQSHPDRATYSRKLTKNDGLIDWNKPAGIIEREIRAYTGWPKSRTKIFEKDIIVTKAHVTEIKEDKLDIECGDGKFLSIDELIAPSGRTMLADAFINGYYLLK